MKIIPLSECPEYRPAILSLIEREFHYTDGQHFDIDFHPLFSLENASHCYVLLDDNTLAGHIGVRYCTLKNDHASIPVAFLGGIVMADDYRGKGLFSPFMREILSRVDENVALSFLWSDLTDLYKKFHFHLAVGQIEHQGVGHTPLEKTKLHLLSSEEKSRIRELYEGMQHRFSVVERNEADWKTLESVTSADWFLYKERNEIHGYWVKGKGHDLAGIVHELAWSFPSEKRFFSSLHAERVWAPESLSPAFPSPSLHHGALVRIGKASLFRHAILDWSRQRMDFNQITHREIHFTLDGEIFSKETPEFLTMLLGPNPANELREIGKPFFISGLDSI